MAVHHLNGKRYETTDPDSVESATPRESCPIADKAIAELKTLQRRGSEMKRMAQEPSEDDVYRWLDNASDISASAEDGFEEMRKINGQLRELLGVALDGWRELDKKLADIADIAKP